MAGPCDGCGGETDNIHNSRIDMIHITEKEVFTDGTGYVHRKGSNSYFKRSTLLPGDSIDSFEETDVIPETDEDYPERVNALIRERYSLSDELALLRQRDTKDDEYKAYYEYAEECKTKAKSYKNEDTDRQD